MSLSVASFPKPERISPLDLLYRLCYGLSVFFWQDLLFWDHRSRSRNPQAEVIGPLYLPNQPQRNVADGKGIIASLETLRAQPVVFLLYGEITDSAGKPIQAEIDIWQADWHGQYSFASTDLRGKVITDAQGRYEIITAPPGGYGGRPGHFHMHITPTGKDADKAAMWFTSQIYLAKGNTTTPLDEDWVRIFRTPRLGNLMKAWAVPLSTPGSFFDLPAMPTDDAKLKDSLVQWDGLLKDVGMSVGAGARFDFTVI